MKLAAIHMDKVNICGINTSHLPKISAKECDRLLLLAAQGDREAKERLVLSNMRLVLSLIKRFSQTKGEADDLFQAGTIGLIKAVDNFDVTLGVRFSTYAVPMILGEIKRLIRSKNSMRVARSIRDTAYKVLKMRSELEKTDDDVTNEKIAKALNIKEREVAFALDAISDPVSIYDPVYNKTGDTMELLDQIADEKCSDENWTENLALRTALERLGEREKKIIYMRYYEGRTQTEISSEIGLSQAQISRIEKNALGEIKGKIIV